MSNVAKLKKKAAEFEQKKQFDKALAVYVQILEGPGADDPDAMDVALYNRVGDLLLRQGDVADALTYYERAVDLYAESGFFNNAIALCNKILRQSPGRASIYYKLGKISARKGFKSDAKQNFLEYADRMQKAGQIDEAFRALKEFADLCPDQDDIRLMLAEQLSKRERKGEALEQLQTLYEKLSAEGRETEARATVDRMKAIDPSVVPRTSGGQRAQKPADLVFLDVSWDDGKPAPARQPAASRPAAAPPAPAAPTRPVRSSPVADLPLILPDQTPAPSVPAAPGGAGRASAAAPAPVPGLELTSVPASTLADDAPMTGSEFATLSLGVSAEQPVVAPQHDLTLPGELPPLDLITADSLGSPHDLGVAGASGSDLGIQHGSAVAGAAADVGAASLDFDAMPDAGGELSFLELGGAADDPLAASTLGPIDVGSALDALDGPLSLNMGAASLVSGIDDDAAPADAPLELMDLAPSDPAPVKPAASAPSPPAAPRPRAPAAADSDTAAGDAAFLRMMSPPAKPAAPPPAAPSRLPGVG
ncbi:MAG: tetratricopeptide repeat protein, partial [Gemmatimonadaceae bacterium]